MSSLKKKALILFLMVKSNDLHYALFNEGDIYVDTDFEVLKQLDDLLYLPAFSGYEENNGSNFPTWT